MSTDNHDERIAQARVIAAFAIVLLHASASAVTGWPFEMLGWWAGTIYNASTRWAVPVFVMLSGATLLAPERLGQSASLFFQRRASRLLLPLCFWSLLYIGWTIWMHKAMGRDPLTSDTLLHLLWQGKPYFHLWFLFMLLGLYAITPTLRWLLVRATDRQALGLALALLAFNAIADLLEASGIVPTVTDNVLTLWIAYVGYFLAGALFARGTLEIPAPKLLCLAGFGAVILGTYCLIPQQHAWVRLYSLDPLSAPVIFMSLAAFQLLSRARAMPWISRMAPMTLGIYLLHPLIMDIVDLTGIRLLHYQPLLSIPVMFLVASVASYWGCRSLQVFPATARLV